MSACDMGALCCKSSPCAYLAVDGSAEEIAALVQKLNAENDILRAEVARLRGALEDIAYARLPGIPDRCTVTVEQVGQFAMQRARTALAKEVGDAT